MIHHNVMFRFREELPEDIKQREAFAFKSAIEALPMVIPFIRSIAVGINCNPSEDWHICLESTFDTLDDVKTYAIHPSHQAAAARLKPFVTGRACTDCEF